MKPNQNNENAKRKTSEEVIYQGMLNGIRLATEMALNQPFRPDTPKSESVVVYTRTNTTEEDSTSLLRQAEACVAFAEEHQMTVKKPGEGNPSLTQLIQSAQNNGNDVIVIIKEKEQVQKVKRAAIYARHSNVTGANAHIIQQLSECTEYAKMRGIEIAKCYTDVGSLSEELYGYTKMMEDAATADWDYVIVTNFNRLMNTVSSVEGLSPLRERGIEVISTSARAILDLTKLKTKVE